MFVIRLITLLDHKVLTLSVIKELSFLCKAFYTEKKYLIFIKDIYYLFLIWAIAVTSVVLIYVLRKLLRILNRCCPELNLQDQKKHIYYLLSIIISSSLYTTSTPTTSFPLQSQEQPQQPLATATVTPVTTTTAAKAKC